MWNTRDRLIRRSTYDSKIYVKIVPLKGTLRSKPCDVYHIAKIEILLKKSRYEVVTLVANNYANPIVHKIILDWNVYADFIRVSIDLLGDEVGAGYNTRLYNLSPIDIESHNWVLNNNEDYIYDN